jgi:hypothetical protein
MEKTIQCNRWIQKVNKEERVLIDFCTGDGIGTITWLVQERERGGIHYTKVYFVDFIYNDLMQVVDQTDKLKVFFPDMECIFLSSFEQLEETISGDRVKIDQIVSFGFQISGGNVIRERIQEHYNEVWERSNCLLRLGFRLKGVDWKFYPAYGFILTQTEPEFKVVSDKRMTGEYLAEIGHKSLEKLPEYFKEKKLLEFA